MIIPNIEERKAPFGTFRTEFAVAAFNRIMDLENFHKVGGVQLIWTG